MSIRTKTIITITETEMRIEDLELKMIGNISAELRSALQEELHEQRQILSAEKERLRTIDNEWILQKEDMIRKMEAEAEAADPNRRKELEDTIREYRQRIEKRKNSTYAAT